MVHNQIYGYFWLLDNRVPPSCSFIGREWVKLSHIWKCKYNCIFLLGCCSSNWERCTIPMDSATSPGFLLALMWQQHLFKQVWHDMDQIRSWKASGFWRVTPFSHQPLWGQADDVPTGQEDRSWIMWEHRRRWPEKQLLSPKPGFKGYQKDKQQPPFSQLKAFLRHQSPGK